MISDKALTRLRLFGWVSVVKWFALLLFVAAQLGCTTLANRRDLYSPEPAPDSHEAVRQMRTRPQSEQIAPPRPQFR
jgi:hypothetical protein